MSAEQAQREPTMEEILASIRRIISEEDKPEGGASDVLDLKPQPEPEPAPEAKAAPPPPKPAPPAPEPAVAKPAPPPAPEVFDEPELEPAASDDEELLIMENTPEPESAPAPPAAAAPKPAPQPEPPPRQQTLVSDPVASKAAGELGKLMGSMLVSTGNTLDDVVRELLKPMLKEWLDANLSEIVEAEVAKEIDRIRRMSR